MFVRVLPRHKYILAGVLVVPTNANEGIRSLLNRYWGFMMVCRYSMGLAFQKWVKKGRLHDMQSPSNQNNLKNCPYSSIQFPLASAYRVNAVPSSMEISNLY